MGILISPMTSCLEKRSKSYTDMTRVFPPISWNGIWNSKADPVTRAAFRRVLRHRTFSTSLWSEPDADEGCDFGPGLKIASFNKTQPQHNKPDFDQEKQIELFYILKLCQQARCLRGGVSFNLIRYDIFLVTVRRRLKSKQLLLQRRMYNKSFLNTFMEV